MSIGHNFGPGSYFELKFLGKLLNIPILKHTKISRKSEDLALTILLKDVRMTHVYFSKILKSPLT